MNGQIAVPREFTRMSELDVLDALAEAEIDLTTPQRHRLIAAMREVVARNQQTYRDLLSKRAG